jgi:hypothetical protein
MAKVSRRELIKATGAIGATILPAALATDTASAQLHDHASQHAIKINRPPMSLAEDAHGHVHVNPGTRATLP